MFKLQQIANKASEFPFDISTSALNNINSIQL